MTAASSAPRFSRAAPRASGPARPATASRWHVSPSVDLLGYAFSWVPVALALYLVLGNDLLRLEDPRGQAYAFLIIGVVLIDVHRHFTFPYVYLSRRLRQTYPLRFWLLPALSLALLVRLPFLAGSREPLRPSEAAAMVAWGVVLLQLGRVDRLGAAPRRRACSAALIGAGGAALLSAVVAPLSELSVAPMAWAWLLGAAGASLAIARAPAPGASTHDVWMPLAAMLALLAGAIALHSSVRVGSLVGALALVYVVWLVFHTIMQKYGILRIYAAKSGVEAKVPRWVDRALVWCWLPMIVVWTGSVSPQPIVAHLEEMAPGTGRLLLPSLALLSAHASAALELAALPIAAGFGAFLYHEWQLHRLRNLPRLAFAAGTGLLYASVFFIGVVGLYVAFAATHCIEYVTFLWAFQRQRFPGHDPDAPLLSRALQWPLLYYGGIALPVAGVFLVARYSWFVIGTDPRSLVVFGAPLYSWAFWYSIVQAFLHFYYDGFLWKMRPELTQAL